MSLLACHYRTVMWISSMVHLKCNILFPKWKLTPNNIWIVFFGETKVIWDVFMQNVRLRGQALQEYFHLHSICSKRLEVMLSYPRVSERTLVSSSINTCLVLFQSCVPPNSSYRLFAYPTAACSQHPPPRQCPVEVARQRSLVLLLRWRREPVTA